MVWWTSCTQLKASLQTSLFGQNLVCLPRTGSTNRVAKDLARKGAPEGTVVVADEQTAGRGRLGRRWFAPPGTCLLCSIVFRPALPLGQVQHLTMLCALAAADAIHSVAGLNVPLKWPNDLVIPVASSGSQSPSWRKLAGLLAETEVAGTTLAFAVVGIGINVNVPPGGLPALAADATSVLAEAERPVNIAELLGALLGGIEARYEALCDGESPFEEWAGRLVTIGRAVEAATPAGILAGVAESVDDTGALLLCTADGTLHKLNAGDVTLRPRG